MGHVPEGLLDAIPELKYPLNFFWGHLVHETPVATAEDLTARISVASTDIAKTSDFLECIRQSFVRRC
ncbi:hypothetical protein TNCV_1443591 [Trichonephila clavipes]|nr:hypothetical protein TNCV_1443591 [Trichonephila clavipes]